MRMRLGAIGVAAVALVTAGRLARGANGRGFLPRRWSGRRLRALPLAPAGETAPRRRPSLRLLSGSNRDRVDRHALLARAGLEIGSSLDYDETLRHIASVCLPALADWCIVDVLGDAGVRRTAVSHTDPRRAPLAERLQDWFTTGSPLPPATRAIETRQPVVVHQVPADYVRRLARDPEQLELLKEMEPASLIAVPLVSGTVLGALVLVNERRRGRDPRELLPLAVEVAQRAATALANAHLYLAAQSAIRARDELLAVVAHDLRNPLHVIEFTARRLRQDVPAPGRRASDRSLDWILSSAQRATALVRDLLDRARVEWQTLSLHLEQVAPAAIVREVARRGEPLAALASVHVAVEVEPELPPVQVDSERLAQAMENLVGNALKFTPPGGRVTVGAALSGEHVRFYVADNGKGIEAEDLGRVFDRFWQARNADARGAGLGLSICKRIVEAHGGRVWVESAIGQGTTVSFTLQGQA